MTKPQIVIITNEFDGHVDDVVPILTSAGQEVVRVNTERFGDGVRLRYEVNTQYTSINIDVLDSHRHFETGNVKSVWWRRPEPANFAESLDHNEASFARGEIAHIYSGIWSSMQCYWMSHPAAIRAATWKSEQLIRAKSFGFLIPKTIITNDPDTVRRFFEEHKGKVIYKSFSPQIINFTSDSSKPGEEELFHIPTTLITNEMLEQLEGLEYAPALFQEYVPKSFELRVTVIGNRVYTARIDSQLLDTSKIDWRVDTLDLPHTNYQLPAHLEKKIIDFVRSYGLSFSALDFIVTPTQEVVFLENNPNGQFLWIPAFIPEFDMATHLAQCLIEGKSL